jgi:hypothetical protein
MTRSALRNFLRLIREELGTLHIKGFGDFALFLVDDLVNKLGISLVQRKTISVFILGIPGATSLRGLLRMILFTISDETFSITALRLVRADIRIQSLALGSVTSFLLDRRLILLSFLLYVLKTLCM